MSKQNHEKSTFGLEEIVNALAAGPDTNPAIREEALHVQAALRLKRETELRAQGLGADELALQRVQIELAKLAEQGFLSQPTPFISSALAEARQDLAAISTPVFETSPLDMLYDKLRKKRDLQLHQDATYQAAQVIIQRRSANDREIVEMIQRTREREEPRYLKRIGAVDLFREAARRIGDVYGDVEVDIFDPRRSSVPLEARWNFRKGEHSAYGGGLGDICDHLSLRAVTSEEVYGNTTIEARTAFIGITVERVEPYEVNGVSFSRPILTEPETAAMEQAIARAIENPSVLPRWRQQKRNAFIQNIRTAWRLARIKP